MEDRKKIDKEYLQDVKEHRRKRLIGEINNMLVNMDDQQIGNVYEYTAQEHDEPNHEAEALEAIVSLSRQLHSVKDSGNGE